MNPFVKFPLDFILMTKSLGQALYFCVLVRIFYCMPRKLILDVNLNFIVLIRLTNYNFLTMLDYSDPSLTRKPTNFNLAHIFINHKFHVKLTKLWIRVHSNNQAKTKDYATRTTRKSKLMPTKSTRTI